MADRFKYLTGNPLAFVGPADSGFAVTPSDVTVFTQPTRSLWIGGAGAVTVRMAGDGSLLTFGAVPAGTELKIRVDKVMAAGTAATLIVGLY